MKIAMSILFSFSLVLSATFVSFAQDSGGGDQVQVGSAETKEVQGLISQQSDDIRIEINKLLSAAQKDILVLKANSAGKYLELNNLMIGEKFDREKALKLIEGIAEDEKKADVVFMDFLLNLKALFRNENDKRKINLYISNGLLFDYFKFLLIPHQVQFLQFPGFVKQDGDKTKEKGKKSDEMICTPAKQ